MKATPMSNFYPFDLVDLVNEEGDNTPTPEWIWDMVARFHLRHFHRPGELWLDPCAGRGSLLRVLERRKIQYEWCEIQLGVDFLDYVPFRQIGTIMSNIPWRARAARPILERIFSLRALHVILIAPHRAMHTRSQRERWLLDGYGHRATTFLPKYDKKGESGTSMTSGGLSIVADHFMLDYSGRTQQRHWDMQKRTRLIVPVPVKKPTKPLLLTDA